MKKIFILLFLSILCLQAIVAQTGDDYAIIYFFRLKKSTDSNADFKIYFDDEYAGEIEGTNNVFRDDYEGAWLVCKRVQYGTTQIRVAYSKKDKTRGKLNVQIDKNQRYFIEFNTSLGYGECPLRIMDREKAFDIFGEADMKGIQIVDNDITEQVKKEKKGGYSEYTSMTANRIDNNTSTEESIYRGSGDPLKGLNISQAIKEMEIGDYYALIIGIDNYTGTWTPLKNAVNDAKAIERLLKTKYKFDHFRAIYNETATRQKIIAEMEWLIANVTEKDNVFIFYSGHGEYKENLNKGYWVPVDASSSSSAGYISNSVYGFFC